MKKLHPTQLGILNRLLFAPNLRYSELKIDPKLENNTFQFHLDKMLKDGYVQKDSQGQYVITTKGKKTATYIDTESNTLVQNRRISARLFCLRDVAHGSPDVLIYTRKKHPFYDHQGFPSGKITYGEVFNKAALRELLEETGLTGKPVLFNISHQLVKNRGTKELLDDKLFFDFFIKNPTGQLKGNQEGEFTWIKFNELDSFIKKPFESLDIYHKLLEQILNFSGVVTFEEIEHLTEGF